MKKEIPVFDLPDFDDIYKVTEESQPCEFAYNLRHHQTVGGIGTSNRLPGADFALGFKGGDGSIDQFRLSIRVPRKFDDPRGSEDISSLFFGFAMKRGEDEVMDGIKLCFNSHSKLVAFFTGLASHFNYLANEVYDLDS